MVPCHEGRTKEGRKKKGVLKRALKEAQRVCEVADRRDDLCARVSAGEVLHIRAPAKGLTAVGTVDEESLITHMTPRDSNGVQANVKGESRWKRVREVYVRERGEAAVVWLFEAAWEIIEGEL